MEARTLRQLIDDCREELDDAAAPYLYQDEVLIRHLNEAVEEACVRARLLLESNRPDICRIQLKPGRADYPLHPAIYVIRRATLADGGREPLCRTTSVALDGVCRDWRGESGTPQFLLRDRQARQISVAPIPEAEQELTLTVWRLPSADEALETDDDEPVIDPIHHRKLIHWCCWRAFAKKDSEKDDMSRASLHLQIFEDYFGERPTARALQQLSIDPVTGTSPHWF